MQSQTSILIRGLRNPRS